ncbi:MAG: hypothetical protein HZC26_03185 [Candidatus Magasanikbacteria bacterium]|nr:hypothetical protein [Candidatus Magasanikbacteria bacterium]
MSRKNILILLAVVLLLVIAGIYYWSNQKGVSVAELINPKTEESLNWDDPDEVFNIKAPDDFDAARLERLEEKITSSKNLYQNQKNDTWTWIVIGNMYEFAHDYDRAIGAYKKVVSMNESEYISRMNLAYIYENQKKDFALAEQYYKEVLNLTEGNPTSYINLAKLYEFKMERVIDAEKIYTDGLAATGDNPDLIVALIRFYQRQDMNDKAVEQAKKLLKFFPDNEAYQNDFGGLIK